MMPKAYQPQKETHLRQTPWLLEAQRQDFEVFDFVLRNQNDDKASNVKKWSSSKFVVKKILSSVNNI